MHVLKIERCSTKSIKNLAIITIIENLPEASKDLQDPSGESIPSFTNCNAVLGLRHKLDPPTIAESQSPDRIACRAWSRASRLEEQAVSMA